MKKILLCLLLGTCACLPAAAQTFDSISPRPARLYMDSLFRFIDSSAISSGVLEEKGIPEIPFRCFSGSETQDSSLDYNRWDQLYEQAYHGRKNSSWLLPSGQQVLERIIAHRVNGHIALPVLFFDYHHISTDSSQEYFSYQQGELHDAPGRSQHPYLPGTCFAATLSRAEKLSGHCSFVLPSDLFFSNKAGPGQLSFAADFDNGAGWQPLLPDSPLAVNYSSEGLKQVKLRASYQGQQYYARSSLYIAFKADIYSGWSWWADAGYSQAQAGVFLAPGHALPTRPIIFVEGFDALEEFDVNDLFNIINNGQANRFLPYINYRNTNDRIGLIDRATDWGYDFIILDLKGNGGAAIEQNAEVLRRLIKAVQQHNPADIVVGGASMGGQVARYCLAKMEKDYCEDPRVSLYISYDSPHQGANIPPAIQFVAQQSNRASLGLVGELRLQAYSLNSPAARQMLVSHIENPYGGSSAMHSQFQAELARLNYPETCRRIAVGLGNSQDNVANTTIVNSTRRNPIYGLAYGPLHEILSYNNNSWMYKDIHCYAQAKFWSPDPIAKIHISYQPRIGNKTLGRIDFINSARWQISAHNYDNAPGGFLYTGRSVADGLNANSFFQGSIASTYARDQHCMIPLVSAIDLQCPQCSTFTQNQNISYFLNNHLVPFENLFFVESNGNEAHASRVPRQASWFILDELQALLPPATPLTANQYLGPQIAAGQTYNFANKFHRDLHSVQVNGKLQVHGNYASDWGNGPVPAGSSQPYQLPTSACSNTVVSVNNGGLLEIGDAASSNHTASLSFTWGSRLQLKNGSVLKVHEGSVLRIAPGARLDFENGAVIELGGANSVLEIQGELNIGAGAVFNITGNGFVRFSLPENQPSQAIEISGAGTFALSKTSKTQKLMELAKGYVHVQTLPLFKIYKGTVELGTDAYLQIEGKTDLQSVIFTTMPGLPAYVHEGVKLGAQPVADITIKHCDFQYAKTGLWRGGGNGIMSLTACHFINCNIGLHTLGNGVAVHYSKMENCSTAGWKAENMSSPSEFKGWCINSLINYSGNSNTNLYVYESKFEDNHAGIFCSGTFSTTVKCSYFSGNYSSILVQNGGTLNLGTNMGIIRGDQSIAYGGSNRFENVVSEDILLSNAFDVVLHNGYNYFSYAQAPQNAAITGTVNNPSYSSSSPAYTLNLDNNYWDFPGGIHTLPGYAFLLSHAANNQSISHSGTYLTAPPSACHIIDGLSIINTAPAPGKKEANTAVQVLPEKEFYYTVFPNPASRFFNIETPGENSGHIQVRLFDMQGKSMQLLPVIASTKSLLFDVSILAAGLYQVKIEKDGVPVETHRISVIKQ